MPGAQTDRMAGGRGAGRTLPSGSGLADFDGLPSPAQERDGERQDTWDGLILMAAVLSVLWLGVSVCYGLLWMVAKTQGWW